MTKYSVIHRFFTDEAQEREQVIGMIMSSPAALSPKFFYDELGCALYGAICQLPEYYPTRTEVGIFQTNRQAIADLVGKGKQFVDLGAGDCCKAQSWLPFLMPRRYIAVDIAGPEIDRALSKLAQDFPEIEMLGLVTDFSQSLDLSGALLPGPATFFYPGSSIGNFTPEAALNFLSRIFALCKAEQGSGLLIGVDAKKDSTELQAAYDDALGVTAAFNRNMLLHLNRRFGFDFDLQGFEHRGIYNAAAGRIEMHLESARDQTVNLGPGMLRKFVEGERIHTENSYKYAHDEFAALLKRAGFMHIHRWTDSVARFNVFYAS